MAQIKKAPTLRFKAFEEEWTEKKLREIAEIVGGGTPSTTNPDYWNGNINWYSPTEIGNNVYASESVKKISKLGLEKSSATILPPNRTVLFTSRAGIGDMAILLTPGATNQGFQSFVLRENFDTYFIYSIGFLIKEFALKYSTGSTFLEISGKTLGRMPINVPSTFEQIQIGNFFKTLDELIALQEQKHTKLKRLKKAMHDKMFPKAGANVPEIRFKGYHEGWSEKKMNQIFDFDIPTNTLSRALLNSNAGTVKNVHYGDILIKYNTILDVERESIPYINSAEPLDYKNHLLKDGDLVFADAAEDSIVGKAVEVTNVGSSFIVAGLHTIVTRPLVSFSKLYLGYFINSNLYQNQLNTFMQGVKVLSISKTSLKKTNIWFPKDLSEQQKIGSYFEKLDKSIEGIQQQIEKYKHIKQALLSKMFV